MAYQQPVSPEDEGGRDRDREEGREDKEGRGRGDQGGEVVVEDEAQDWVLDVEEEEEVRGEEGKRVWGAGAN